MINKGKIIIYDDDSEIIRQFKELMHDSGFEIISFTDLEILRSAFSDKELINGTKILVFDLARDEKESSLKKDFAILNDIDKKFNDYRIPIFIHSAFANDIERFENNGTVWKIEKSGESIVQIVEIIKKLDDSGFLEAFTPGGFIERSIYIELQKSFTEQFRKGEIEGIIDLVKNNDDANYKKRLIDIFKRIAIKSLNATLMIPIAENADTLNPIEHFYRRTNLNLIWTGDIWRRKDSSETVFILTPRCDLSIQKSSEIICCQIRIPNLTFTGNKEKRLKELNNHLTDNLLGKSTRYIPSNPFYVEGGFIDLAAHKTISKESLFNEFRYLITLSDDFTNEIVGKFASYFLRTGLPTICVSEFDTYLKLVAEANASQ